MSEQQKQPVRELTFTRVVAWVSDPQGVEIVADPTGAWLKVAGQVIFGMHVEPSSVLVILDDAIVLALQEDGVMGRQRVTGAEAMNAARNLTLDTNRGQVGVGPIFVPAWEEHIRMVQELRKAPPKLVALPGARG